MLLYLILNLAFLECESIITISKIDVFRVGGGTGLLIEGRVSQSHVGRGENARKIWREVRSKNVKWIHMMYLGLVEMPVIKRLKGNIRSW